MTLIDGIINVQQQTIDAFDERSFLPYFPLRPV